ncbi:MAG TPA: T9SS type A sorting domain-containing protein, partial [Bacteroidia bacterium]|nr:T9SS type A sorting domain-containing protein [Bacteroidia bacterium]HMY14650.1 T9SS type A sorting domain-containing protein [Bacteroidia bacterium]HNO82970.1 T9SS type A sorting domain-containing protein [Bacteroidia bacterium]
SCGKYQNNVYYNDLWELSEVTSIAEATPSKPQVYFNQSAQVLHVSGLKNKPTTLTITSMTGQIVLHQVCTKENMQLPLALAKGVYSYSLAGNEEQTSGKFEIMH